MWTDGIAFEQFGVRFGIRTDSPHLMEHIIARLPPGWSALPANDVDVLFSLRVGRPARRGVRRYQMLYEGIRLRQRALDQDALLDALESALLIALAERAKDWTFVHAGVVGWQDQAILIPGTTLSGKTSLVAALLRAGATFYSDDLAVIDSRGWVHPYPTPLSIRETPGARQVPVEPAAFGAATGAKALPVGLVAFTKFQTGASWMPKPLPAGQAMLALLQHTSALRTRPRTVLQSLERMMAGAAAYSGLRGDALETAERLLTLL